MRHSRRRTPLLLCLIASLAVTALAAPASSSAAIVGIGDQKPETFTVPLFQQLRVKRTRYITPWNSIFTEPERLDAWIKAARAARTEPLIAFEKARTQKCPSRSCRPPSVRSYTRAFKAFRRKYPTIRLIQPWNEVNSPTQPTGRSPRRAAELYNAVRANCRGCTIPAADIQDLSVRTMTAYLRTFRRYARGNPKLWGLHNYSDTNRNGFERTQAMLRLVPGRVWLTETGGLFSFRNPRSTLRPSESRQARAVTHMYRIARRYRSRIQRIYIYQWSPNNTTDVFDAGVVNADNTPRQAYGVVRRNRSFIK
jgi:hypothetical protein